MALNGDGNFLLFFELEATGMRNFRNLRGSFITLALLSVLSAAHASADGNSCAEATADEIYNWSARICLSEFTACRNSCDQSQGCQLRLCRTRCNLLRDRCVGEVQSAQAWVIAYDAKAENSPNLPLAPQPAAADKAPIDMGAVMGSPRMP